MSPVHSKHSPGPRWSAQVQYESKLDPAFSDAIASLPGAEKLMGCIQCGTCTGSCPVCQYMDLSPRQIIAMTRAGFKDEVLGCFTIWLCASCYACTVACPKQIQITDIMYALKREAIREHRHPKAFLIPALAREFFHLVREQGRNSEGILLLRLYGRTQPLLLVRNMFLGIRLWLRGRMGIKMESVRDRASVWQLLERRVPDAAEKETAA
jgi:heterodisulfide reductase subunit C